MGRPTRRTAPEAAPDAPGLLQRVRIYAVVLAFVLAYMVIAVRLFRVHVDPDVRFSQEDLNHIGETQIHRPRGDILDRNGRVLATDRLVHSLSADPSDVTNAEALADFLAERLGVERAMTLERLSRTTESGRKMRFVWIKRYLTEAEEEALGSLADVPDGDALSLEEERIRFYPEGQTAAHVLGFANRESQGSEGVELSFDSYLRSQPGWMVSRVDNKRNLLRSLTLEHEPPTGGDDVYLTLDTSLQFTLERELDAAIVDKHAKGAMGVLMDPYTGEILAFATRPAFDPNNYWDFPAEARKNRALVDVFEPGSAFKIVTASAALEHGLVTPTTVIDCERGSFNPYGHRIKDTHPLGVVPFAETFAQSSNIAMIKVAAMLGAERFESWIRRYGFGRRTGIELPGESGGIFRPTEKWSRLSMGSLPMGQEVSVNMLQLAQAFSVIANGGYLVQPHIVSRAVSQEGGRTYGFEQAHTPRVLSPATSATMRELCYGVVALPDGTGRYAVIDEYRAGGKTGTAQIAKPNGGGYYSDRYTTVFAGFAPISDPRLVCVIVVQEPMIALHYGGYVCGPVFKNVMREALIRMKTPAEPMPSLAQRKLMTATQLTVPSQDPDTIVARLNLTAMEPSELALAEPDALMLLHESDTPIAQGPSLPDFSGMSKRQAKTKLVELGLPWDPQGAGRVVGQDPPPGTLLEHVTVCKLVFSTAGQNAANDV